LDTNSILLIVLLVVLLLAVVFLIPQWRLRRAIPKVIRAFKECDAIGIKNAKTIDELGLRPRGMVEQMLKGRDYRQDALNALMRAGIIQMTEEGRLYLLEEKLIESGLGGGTSYSR